MIEGTIIKNGKIKLVIYGTDEIDEAILKQLSNAKVTLSIENMRLGDKNIVTSLTIEENIKGE